MEKQSWFKQNIATILSTLTILAAVALGYGELRATVNALTLRMDRVQQSIESHRDKLGIHVDDGFKDEMRDQLAEIRLLLLNHMATTQKAGK